jgi:hypothetical protein
MTRLLLIASLLSITACGGEAPGTDAGQPGLDAGRDAGAAHVDAGAPVDASSPSDAGSPEDAGAHHDAASVDAGQDAHVPDEDGGTDAGPAQPDACVPPPCPAPPDGCHYEGFTACTCGTLVCAPSACAPACDATKYCDLCGTERTCVDRPEDMGLICIGLYMPVCGCDGQTYSNSCVLGSAGIGLLHEGECGTTE